MSDRKTAWLLWIAAFLLLLPGAFYGVPDGKFVVGATRILAGEIPYRDFWTMYAPGTFYATAALFAVCGRELAVQGAACCALWAACAAVLHLLLRDAGARRGVALSCSVVLALARWHTSVELSSYEPAFLLALLAFRSFQAGRGFRAGLLLGAAAVFKHDVAAYAAAGATIASLCERRNPVPLLLGAAAVVAPAALLLAVSAGAEAWQDLVVFPSTDFRLVRGELFPALLPRTEPLAAFLARPTGIAEARAAAIALARWIQCALPQIVFLVAAFAALRLRGRAPRSALLALACLPFFWLAAHVQQNTHLHSMAALSLVLLSLAWEARASLRPVLAAVGGVYALALLCPPAVAAAAMARELSSARLLGIPGAEFVLAPARVHEVLRPIAALVRTNVPEGEPIYVGLGRHDATVFSNPILYFLCARAPSVQNHELHPGITDREDVQADMIGRIDGLRVRCLVLWDFGWSKARLDAIRDWNRAAVQGAGSSLLDEWIEESYAEIAAFGEYRVLWRRE